MTEMTNAEQMEAIGGRRWQKNGKDRVYFDASLWAAWIGLEISRYGSGNISYAALNGEKISNGKAAQLLNMKVYWDAADRQIHVQGEPRGFVGLEEAIANGAARAVAALPADNEDEDGDDDAATPGQFSQILKRLRSAGRTVRQIAEMVGVSVSTIYRWAHGICRPRPTNAAALAALA